jgi:hypothetical protein
MGELPGAGALRAGAEQTAEAGRRAEAASLVTGRGGGLRSGGAAWEASPA